MVHIFMTLESGLRFSLLSTNVAVPGKVIGKMLALYVILHVCPPFVAEIITESAFVPTFSSDYILLQFFIAAWVKPGIPNIDCDELFLGPGVKYLPMKIRTKHWASIGTYTGRSQRIYGSILPLFASTLFNISLRSPSSWSW